MTTMNLRARVFASCEHAVENGYDVDQWTASAIAADIKEYDAELEGFSESELLPHAQAWLDQRPLTYYSDAARHLVCKPYSVKNLHRMADELGINRCWYHSSSKHKHYDVPKRRVSEIAAKTSVVDPRQILAICRGEF